MRKILLADDQPSLRGLLVATLEGGEYDVLEASNGPEALALARAEQPNLLVIDWMMPGLSGLEVVRELRQDKAFAGMRIILLTARTEAADRNRGIAAGADVFLSKPFSPLALLEHVETLLGPGDMRPSPFSQPA